MCGNTTILTFQSVTEASSRIDQSTGVRIYTFVNNCDGKNRSVKIIEEGYQDQYLLCKIIVEEAGDIVFHQELSSIFIPGVLVSLSRDMGKFQDAGPVQCVIMGGQKIAPK